MTADVGSERRRWITAAATLAKDPTARVLCPTRGDDYLSVEDVPYDADPTMFARYLRCPKCGAVEVLDRLRRGEAEG